MVGLSCEADDTWSLELRFAGQRGGVRPNFQGPSSPSAGHLDPKQPLLRAVGGRERRVFDATAGFGEDAFLLATFGHEVVLCERSPVLVALLREGLERAVREATQDTPRWDLLERLSVTQGDAREILPEISPPPDVVYLDPMFPPKRKRSALPRKEMQILRHLVGADLDAAETLATARQHCSERVVVKRPTHCNPLAPNPQSQKSGKLIRYDVYPALRRHRTEGPTP